MNERPRVYIAAPYTLGDVGANVGAAIKASARLVQLGFAPFVPHLYHFQHVAHPERYATWLKVDLAWLEVADAILRLPGPSRGATLELDVARALRIPVFFVYDDLIKWRDARKAAG